MRVLGANLDLQPLLPLGFDELAPVLHPEGLCTVDQVPQRRIINRAVLQALKGPLADTGGLRECGWLTERSRRSRFRRVLGGGSSARSGGRSSGTSGNPIGTPNLAARGVQPSGLTVARERPGNAQLKQGSVSSYTRRPSR